MIWNLKVIKIEFTIFCKTNDKWFTNVQNDQFFSIYNQCELIIIQFLNLLIIFQSIYKSNDNWSILIVNQLKINYNLIVNWFTIKMELFAIWFSNNYIHCTVSKAMTKRRHRIFSNHKRNYDENQSFQKAIIHNIH